jgi:hypothetical protein
MRKSASSGCQISACLPSSTPASAKTLAACQEELVVMRQELLATQERLKMEEEKARELRDDVNLTKQQNDELHVLLDQRDEYIFAADNAKRAERQRKIKQDEKAKQRSRLDPFFSSQVGSPMRKVQEARQKLAKDYERKGDQPVPPLPSFYARFPVAEAAQVKGSVTVALRSCLKKPVAAQALACPGLSTVDLRDSLEDVRSPRKNRDLRRFHKVAHIYTPTETLPLTATLASAVTMCPATPQQKLRSDGDLQTTVLIPCTKGNIPNMSPEARKHGKYMPVNQIVTTLGSKSSTMPNHLALPKRALSQATSPARPFKRAQYFPGAGQDTVKIDNRRC